MGRNMIRQGFHDWLSNSRLSRHVHADLASGTQGEHEAVVRDRLPTVREAQTALTNADMAVARICPYCKKPTLENGKIDSLTNFSRCMECDTLLPSMSANLAQRIAASKSVAQAHELSRTLIITYWTLEMGIIFFAFGLLFTMLSVGNIPQYSGGIIFFATSIGMLIGGVLSYVGAQSVDKAARMFVGSFIAAVFTYALIQILFLSAHDAIMSLGAANLRLTPERVAIAVIALSTFIPGARIGLWLRGR